MFMNDAWKIRNTLTYQMTIRLTNVPLKSDLTLTFKLILTVFLFFFNPHSQLVCKSYLKNDCGGNAISCSVMVALHL